MLSPPKHLKVSLEKVVKHINSAKLISNWTD